MEFAIISVVAFTTAILTLFSGFGLGTLLFPAFALFLPLPVAVAATAVVHGANNLLKVSLLFQFIEFSVLRRFGIAAVFASFIGAWGLLLLADINQNLEWSLYGWKFSSTLLKVSLGGLILMFALIELSGLKKAYHFSAKWLPVGGVISGFFGGLSGHQGAFRSMFLLNVGLNPKQFVATQSIIAFAVDLARVLVYLVFSVWLTNRALVAESLDIPLVICGTVAAFAGTLVGKKYLEKSTMRSIRWITSLLLFIVGIGLVGGFI